MHKYRVSQKLLCTGIYGRGELKAALTTHIQQIPPTTLLKVFDNMKKRVQTCLQARGGHFQHLL
jgi:hypothetical protein